MAEPAIYAFVVWSHAMLWSEQILSTLDARFTIREALRVTWAPSRFASNLSRLYGDTLPPGSEKEQETGTGPFLLVVVEDPAPRRRLRRTTRGPRRVNATVFDTRTELRRLAGGGFRIHATLTRQETEKDIFLVVGRRAEEFLNASRWDRQVHDLDRDLIGSDGWRDESQLLHALDVCGGCVALAGVGNSSAPLVLLVGDAWWAERIAQGTAEPDRDRLVEVAGTPRALELRQAGRRDARRLRRRTRKTVAQAISSERST